MTAFAEACAALAAEPKERAPKQEPRHRSTRGNPYGLTARELEVVALVVEGAGNLQIAFALGIGEHTAKFHVGHVMDKMRCRSRTQLAVKWVREQEFGAKS